MAMDELYLENIDELVTDQNKIVTYKWLSHTLGVHVNQAKQMLYDYVTRKRKENTSAQVHVTYLVTGKCIQNGYSFHKVAVVKEEKLEATKAKLTVVANVHVYSIQKASLKDSAPLFNTDYDIIKNNLQNCNKFSAIQCPEAVPRSAEEMSQLRNANCPQTEEVHVPPKPAINGHIPAPTAPKANTQQTKGIMGMFNRPASKPPEAQKETKSEPTEPAVTASGSKASAKSNAMNNFFGKASLNKIRDVSSTKDAIKEEKAASPTPPPVRDETPPEQAVKPPEKAVKPSEPAKAPSKEKKRIKRAEMSDSDEEGEKVVKKRRRIKRPKSDSSDDETGPPPPEVKTPSPPPSPPHPPPPEPALKTEAESQSRPQPGGKRRKRKRVLKSKTFLDEDGSIVTEKAYVSESCTDSEEEFTKPKPAAVQKPSTTGAAKQEPKETKTSKKASVAKGGTKQASIMGFFQKK
ncbi:DNA polymerase delta subunit 3 [Rhinophrynus dorsalis]